MIKDYTAGWIWSVRLIYATGSMYFTFNDFPNNGRRRNELRSKCAEPAMPVHKSGNLPGALFSRSRGGDISGMWKWSEPLGRCHLCDADPIILFDPVDQLGVCEVSFVRESAVLRNFGRVSERLTVGFTVRLRAVLNRIKERAGCSATGRI
jgi:hypothetical protein